MSLILGGIIGETIGKVIDGAIDIVRKLVPDKDKQLEAEAELRTLQISLERELRAQEHDEKMAQAEINKIDASSSDAYQRRARPTVMWICALAFCYAFLLYPLLQWVGAIWYPTVTYPELPNIEYMMTALFALLGLGGFRTVEKIKGVA